MHLKETYIQSLAEALISLSFVDIWGVSRHSPYDDTSSYIQWVHPIDRERVRTNFNKLPDEPFRVGRPDEKLAGFAFGGNASRESPE